MPLTLGDSDTDGVLGTHNGNALPRNSRKIQSDFSMQTTAGIARHCRLGRLVAHLEMRAVQAGSYRANRLRAGDGRVRLRSWLTVPPCDPLCSPPVSDR